MKSIFWMMIFYLLSLQAQVYDHHSFKKFEAPQRDLAIVVTPEGYYPDRLVMFEGEKVRFFVTATTADAKCLIVENHPVFLPATKGRLTEAEVVFDKAGEFSYYCPSFAHRGKLVVLGERERAQPVVKINRDPASSSSIQQNEQGWVPKEY